jgi:hypothetical protein
MDALSDVLKSVRLEGALYLNAEFAAPWCMRCRRVVRSSWVALRSALRLVCRTSTAYLLTSRMQGLDCGDVARSQRNGSPGRRTAPAGSSSAVRSASRTTFVPAYSTTLAGRRWRVRHKTARTSPGSPSPQPPKAPTSWRTAISRANQSETADWRSTTMRSKELFALWPQDATTGYSLPANGAVMRPLRFIA